MVAESGRGKREGERENEGEREEASERRTANEMNMRPRAHQDFLGW
jgi:hypothetical protein